MKTESKLACVIKRVMLCIIVLLALFLNGCGLLDWIDPPTGACYKFYTSDSGTRAWCDNDVEEDKCKDDPFSHSWLEDESCTYSDVRY